MHIPASLLVFTIILYINHNIPRIKKYIQGVGLFGSTVIGLICFAISVWVLPTSDSVNVTTLFLGLVVWVLFELYGRINNPVSSRSTENFVGGPPINAQTFYDVVAREIISIREQLTRIDTRQDSLGWDKYFNKDFIYKTRLYPQYRKHYIADHYRPPEKENEWGCIILIVGEDIFGNIIHYDREQMDIEKLIKLHNGLERSEHKTFQKGSFIHLYMQEKDVYVDSIGTREALRAEILSIKKDHDIFYTNTKITLKVDLNSNQGPRPGCPDLEPEFVTRTIGIFHGDHFFIDDGKHKN